MTDVNKLAESLRAMRRNVQRHYNTAMELRHSITMDSTRLGDLTDAADLIERQAKDVHDLNWALGTPGYETMHDPEEQAASEAAHASALANIERMKARRDRHNALLQDGADPLDEIERLRAELARMNALAARLQAQKPVAWVRYASDGSIQGPLLDAQIEDVRRAFWTPLIAAEWVNRDVQAAQDGADDPHLSARFEGVV